MTDEIRPGYYRDEEGNWQKDRRKGGPDRRKRGHEQPTDRDRRAFYRRKADRELYERDHKEMIEDALDDFTAEHDKRF